tara:strand:- start:120 stop:644 length:525 start_codon:yes stop_codon:yes gene_type:complete
MTIHLISDFDRDPRVIPGKPYPVVQCSPLSYGGYIAVVEVENDERLNTTYGHNGAHWQIAEPDTPIPNFDLIAHLHRQKCFSLGAFGPGSRVNGVLDHITKEIAEVRENPDDLSEWVDLMLLAFDGAWRQGFTAQQITDAIAAKQTKNENRTWPDWRTADPDKAIEHDRSSDAA